MVSSGRRSAVLAVAAVVYFMPAFASAQSILPKPDAPFTGVIGQTFRDSKEDYPQPIKAPANAPNVLLILVDDLGFGQPGTFGGPVPTPNLDKLGVARAALQRVQHHCDLLTHTRGAADRPQPSPGRHRHDHRTLHRLSRLQQRAGARTSRVDRRGGPAERLCHQRIRQMAQYAGLGDKPNRPVRPLADRTGF